MSEVDKLHDELERQREVMAGLRNEIATKDKRIAELEAENEQLQESLDDRGIFVWKLVAMKDRALAEYEQIVAELKAQIDEYEGCKS